MDDIIISDERELLREENDRLSKQVEDLILCHSELKQRYKRLETNHRLDVEILTDRAERAEERLEFERKRHHKELQEMRETCRWHNTMGAIFAALGGFLVAGIVLWGKISGSY